MKTPLDFGIELGCAISKPNKTELEKQAVLGTLGLLGLLGGLGAVAAKPLGTLGKAIGSRVASGAGGLLRTMRGGRERLIGDIAAWGKGVPAKTYRQAKALTSAGKAPNIEEGIRQAKGFGEQQAARRAGQIAETQELGSAFRAGQTLPRYRLNQELDQLQQLAATGKIDPTEYAAKVNALKARAGELSSMEHTMRDPLGQIKERREALKGKGGGGKKGKKGLKGQGLLGWLQEGIVKHPVGAGAVGLGAHEGVKYFGGRKED